MKKTILIILITSFTVVLWGQNQDEKKMNTFISSLLKKMTIEEKLGQLNLITPFQKTGPFANTSAAEKMKTGIAGNVYAIIGNPQMVYNTVKNAENTRLKIPMLSGLDIIHGYKTVFPIPLGMSCSWDTTFIEKTARVAAIEGTAAGYNWTFSPMVDLTRDPRWGRVMEGSGEDPYLGGIIARAMVKGYQGKGLNDRTSMMACVKHFGMYGAAEAGRDYNTTDMNRLTMYSNYLVPYKAAVQAGAGSIMTSFNDIEGVPATINKWLLTDLLRVEWGFKGMVVTDFNCIGELLAHGVAEDAKQASELSLKAGVDLDMASESMVSTLQKSLDEGNISIKEIDNAVRKVLEAKYKLGLFDNPYLYNDLENAAKVTLTNENKLVSKEAALKSIVLLENNGVLPLNKNNKIALIGPLANRKNEMFSMWAFSGDAGSAVTILDGIKNKAVEVVYAEGSLVDDNPITLAKNGGKVFDESKQESLIAEALEIAKSADVIVAYLGESSAMSGEAKSRTNISIPNCQRELLKKLKSTGKPIVLVLINGRPLTIQDDLKYADAVLETWKLGTEAGNAVADVIFGDYNPSGKLTMTFPRSVGQIPIYYNHKNTGRPYTPGVKETFVSNYTDEYNTPLYPFGYGLSYTTFNYGDIQLSDSLLTDTDRKLIAKIKVTNTGKISGEETVQMYLHDPVASVASPVKELKSFRKVFLQPGETREVTFSITPEDLKFYNSNLNWDWESGRFVVYIGTNSQEVKEAKFVWNK